MLERLESRTLLTAELTPDGTLEVIGTDQNDNIRLFISDGQMVVRDDSGDTPFAASDVRAVHIQAGDGDDHVQLDPDIPFAEMEGRSGDDTFVAAQDGEKDTLLGGSGTDTADSIDFRLDDVEDVENAPTPPSDGEITVLRGLNELVDGKSIVDFGAVNIDEAAT